MQNKTDEYFVLWDTGLTLREIADRYGTSKQTIFNHLLEHPDYNPRERLYMRNESIKDYYLNKPDVKMEDIARIHKVSLSTVEKVCRDLPGRYNKQE